MMILLEQIKILVNIGVYEHEINPQPVFIDLKLVLKDSIHVESDDISQTIDYDQVVGLIENFVKNKHFNLIEKLTKDIASLLMEQLELIHTLDINVHKILANKKIAKVSVNYSTT